MTYQKNANNVKRCMTDGRIGLQYINKTLSVLYSYRTPVNQYKKDNQLSEKKKVNIEWLINIYKGPQPH